MKSKTITAIAIASAVLIFAFFQFRKTKEQKPFLLTGEWQVDSMYSIGASKNGTPLLLTSTADSLEKAVLTFHADSSITQERKPKDSASEKYYLRDSLLFVNEGNGFMPYKILQMADSNFSFVTKDSLVLVLKRK
jgi:hypothetical protein